MDEHRDRVEHLERQLRDERSLRLAAERRAATLGERAATWRDRAEQRAERIAALEQERDLPLVRRAAGALRRGLGPAATRDGDRSTPSAVSERTAAERVADGHTAGDGAAPWRAYPSTRVLALTATAATDRLVDQFLRLDPSDDRAWHETDLVLVEDEAWAAADESLRRRVAEWVATVGRAPAVRVASPGGTSPFGPRDAATVAWSSAVDGATSFAPVVDLDGPGPWSDVPVVVRPDPDLARPTPEVLAAAAAGALAREGRDEERSRAVAYRLALRRHAPWTRAAELVALTGVAAAPRRATVGVALVSRRPDEVAAALRRVLRSRHVDLEVVVGVHGSPVPADVRELAEATAVPVTVLALDRTWTLGACLNEAIAHTGAPVVAKVDDDDHYGPGHLEDGLISLRHARADLVGKAEQFTWVESVDRTVRRRVGTSHTELAEGTPSGATWVLRRSTWEQAPFPDRVRRVDDLALAAVRRAGGRVYVNGPWEFCVTRRVDGHTWIAADESFLAGAREEWEGRHDDRVELDEDLLA